MNHKEKFMEAHEMTQPDEIMFIKQGHFVNPDDMKKYEEWLDSYPSDLNEIAETIVDKDKKVKKTG